MKYELYDNNVLVESVPFTEEELYNISINDCYQKRTSSLREGGYGTVGEQLDMLFHDGFEVWAEHIQTVKNNFPKP